MPKIHEEQLVIKFYKLKRNNDDSTEIIGDELTQALTSVVEELVGDSIVVEVESVK
jgi:hypothetical protein